MHGPVPDGWYSYPVDACLGVEGLPQSGTGQISLLTGINAARKLGHHHGPFPHTSQRKWLVDDSIATDCNRSERSWDLLNVYPAAYFQSLHARKIRLSTFGFLQTLNGKALHPMESLQTGIGFPPVLDFQPLQRFGFHFNIDFPHGSAQRLIDQFSRIDFGITEYFELDYFGHRQDRAQLVRCFQTISTFLETLASLPGAPAILISSDHGNAESLSTNGHTRHPVPMIMNFSPPFVPSSITDLRVLLNHSLSK